MRLDANAFAYASAALFGGCALGVGLMNLASPGYGQAFLDGLASVYPGYHGDRTFEGVLVVTGYALLEGAVVGWLLAGLYNRLVQ